MPDVLERTKKFIGWEQWLEYLEALPCAAYAVKNDDGLTLLGGNRLFYQLFGCTETDIRLKYGGRLSAVLDADPLRTLPLVTTGEPVGPICVKQRLTRGGTNAWILNELVTYPSHDGGVFCCTATDVTDYERSMQTEFSFADGIRNAAKLAKLDYFEYDFETDTALVRSTLSILPEALVDSDGVSRKFVKRILAGGTLCQEHGPAFKEAFRTVQGADARAMCEVQLKHEERGVLWVRLTLSLQADGLHAAGLLEDITREKETARNYLYETQFYQALLTEKDAYGHIDVTEDRIIRAGGMWNLYNEVIDKITYTQLVTEFIHKVVHPEDRKHYLEVMQRENFIQSLENGIDQLGCEFRRIVEQNKMVWMQLGVHLFRDPITSHVLALLTIRNIDASKKQELLLLHDSRTDQLTHVYNRRTAENAIRDYLAQVLPEEMYAFVVLDIDDFKLINDNHGHNAGDQVLVRLSDFLNRSFRQSDIVGRFGGDEFIILLVNVDGHASVEARVSELLELLRSDTTVAPILCSAGIALCHGPMPYEHLFHLADQALYCAKLEGKGRYLFYNSSMLSLDDSICSKPVRGMPPAVTALEKAREQPEPASVPATQPPAFLRAQAPPAPANQQNFHQFVSAQGDIAYLVNPDTFDLICGNQAFYDRLGVNEVQCAGLKCYEALHKRDTPCPFCSKANWATDKFYMWRNLNAALEQEFLIKNKLVSWQGREALLAIAVDISNDKSIVDSMENSAMESHSILSGVQHMAEAGSLSSAITCALEIIGNFFRADAVRFWQHSDAEQKYTCEYFWTRSGGADQNVESSHAVSAWLENRSWELPVMVESPEAMLSYSYDMYQHMMDHSIRNQRWVRIRDGEETLGFIAFTNSSSNFQNIAFLESFSVFIANELKKRSLMENTIYADKHDDLTNLLSRRSFEEFMLAYEPDQIACIGVLVANFNNLKGINSTRGFQTGNYYIQQFAETLREVFVNQRIFRLNGDEFLVILPEVTRNALEEYVARLGALIEEIGVYTVSIGTSWDDVENDISVLIEQATEAMHVNKKRHYDATPSSADAERRKMLNDLVMRIENGEFEVFMQPKVELLHGTIIGAEALIRYHHKKLGYIQPAQFIEILEKNNLIRYIDLFVFEQVCKQLEAWKQQGVHLPVISLNFSRLTLLERDILSTMEEIISHYDVSRKYLEIEITESIASMGKSILYQATQDLYRAGFAISLDDFGTKYTNLATLAELDFSILKVDKSLVGELNNQLNHRLIMKNIISMCKDLGIRVLAEGIETKAQENILQTMACHLGQGYLYGKPMPIAEFTDKYVSQP